MLIAERFFSNGGWVQIFLIATYGTFLTYKMQDPRHTAKWRVLSWSLFSVVFFTQLILGVTVSEKFLMSGKLHLPIPAMIIAGPIYRGQITFMAILFLSTIILTGPAWCSHLCYFGAVDGISSSGKKSGKEIKRKLFSRHTVLILVIVASLILRFFGFDPLVSILAGITFGVVGLIIILFISRKKGRMVHCIAYCPVGTLVGYLKYLNPMRIRIDAGCTYCYSCTRVCRYDALTDKNLKEKKPGITCTLCGDCITSCHDSLLGYKFPGLNRTASRHLYLFLTISIHSIFMALAKI